LFSAPGVDQIIRAKERSRYQESMSIPNQIGPVDRFPGDMYDHVKLCTYLSPGDLRLLWTSFKSLCAQLDPSEPQRATRPITNLRGFWKRILDAAINAAAAGEYPFECTVTFYRGDLFLILHVLERILTGPQRDWLTDPAKKALVELRNFFSDRLYDRALEQGIGAPYRRQEAVLNDFYLGKADEPFATFFAKERGSKV
jgi:hypothetical protein